MYTRMFFQISMWVGLLLVPLLNTSPGTSFMQNSSVEGPFFRLQKVDDQDYQCINSMALSPNGAFLVCIVVAESCNISVFETATGKKLWQVQHPKKGRGFSNVLFGKDNDRFACYCDDHGLQIRDVKTGGVRRTIPDLGFAVSFINADNGVFLVVEDKRNQQVLRLWDWNGAKPRLQMHLEPAIVEGGEGHAVAFSPDGQMAATAGFETSLELWDMQTGKRIRPLGGLKPAISWISFSPDGKTLAAASNKGKKLPGGEIKTDGSIDLWNVQDGTLKMRIPIGHHLHQVRFSPDGKTLACCGLDPHIRLFDAKTGKAIPPIDTKEEYGIGCLAFTPDSKRLFSGDERGIRLWDLTTSTEIKFKH